MSLSKISLNYGTDKGPRENGYTVVYDMFIGQRRHEPINLLEIGLARGGPEVGGDADREVIDVPSVRMWRDFLPNAHIYGADISDFSSYQSDNFTFFRVDCGNRDELRKIAEAGVEFHVIVDDGSHASYHQQLTWFELFRSLAPGGLYIIEDLNWQPQAYEAELPPVPKTAKILTDLVVDGRSDAVPQEVQDELGGIFLFGDDELARLRRRENARLGVGPLWGMPADGTLRGLAATRPRVRRTLQHLRNTLRLALGREHRPTSVKLAVLQKRFAD